MIKSNLGKNIQHFRKYANLTQQELADKVGVSRATISSWEVDRTEPSMEDVKKMASVLDCTLNDIIGNSKEDLIKDRNIQIILSLVQKLDSEKQADVIRYLQYLIYTARTEG